MVNCWRCSIPITNKNKKYTKISGDQYWHNECFTCYRCKRSLNTQTAKLYSGEIYCNLCYPLFIMEPSESSVNSRRDSFREVHSCSCIPYCVNKKCIKERPYCNMNQNNINNNHNCCPYADEFEEPVKCPPSPKNEKRCRFRQPKHRPTKRDSRSCHPDFNQCPTQNYTQTQTSYTNTAEGLLNSKNLRNVNVCQNRCSYYPCEGKNSHEAMNCFYIQKTPKEPCCRCRNGGGGGGCGTAACGVGPRRIEVVEPKYSCSPCKKLPCQYHKFQVCEPCNHCCPYESSYNKNIRKPCKMHQGDEFDLSKSTQHYETCKNCKLKPCMQYEVEKQQRCKHYGSSYENDSDSCDKCQKMKCSTEDNNNYRVACRSCNPYHSCKRCNPRDDDLKNNDTRRDGGDQPKIMTPHRHYKQTRGYENDKKYCSRCGEIVYAAEKIQSSVGSYHIGCFCCAYCGKTLNMSNVYTSADDVYCKKCYMIHYGINSYGYQNGICG